MSTFGKLLPGKDAYKYFGFDESVIAPEVSRLAEDVRKEGIESLRGEFRDLNPIKPDATDFWFAACISAPKLGECCTDFSVFSSIPFNKGIGDGRQTFRVTRWRQKLQGQKSLYPLRLPRAWFDLNYK